jgi:hypothetical protein
MLRRHAVKAAKLREKRLRLERMSGVRMRESRLTIALTALKLADCQGRLYKSRKSAAGA